MALHALAKAYGKQTDNYAVACEAAALGYSSILSAGRRCRA